MLWLVLFSSLLFAQRVHEIRPGQNPQAVADAAAAGDRLVFLPGVHEHPLRKHQSLLYVEKALDIELQAGATLRLQTGQTVLETTPEITTDHGAPKTFDDFSVGGRYDRGLGATVFTIRIDGTGVDGAPDTFSWGSGELFDVKQAKVPVTGDLQLLSNGVRIKFDRRSGHTVGSLWFVSYDGRESYGIRVGHGTQRGFIENVRIFGKGTVDLNSANNVQPSGLVKNISACVLVHGRVRNISVEEITMRNTMRSVMLYGEHTGKFLQGGGTEGGESFDGENISIFRTTTINPGGSAYLLGHPSHRGRLSKVRCNFNYVESATTSIEPNFNLDQYEVIGNVIKSAGRAIHCWRRSTNGLVADNVRIDDKTGKEVVMVNAPGAWQSPENIILRNNRNHGSESLGHWASVSGGMDNRATGAFSAVNGGKLNEAVGSYSQALGLQARAGRAGEVALAGGAFAAVGDAQTSELVATGVTEGAGPVELLLAGKERLSIAPGSTATFRVLVAARGGGEEGAFEARGAARWVDGKLVVSGGDAAVLFRSSPGLGFTVAGGDRLRLLASGGKLRWVARVELVEVRY